MEVSEPRLVVVLSPHQNVFFPELVEVLVDELGGAGVDVVVTTEPGDHEVGPDDVFVLVPPHEYVALEGPSFVDDPAVAARTIGVSAEQPHQWFFGRNAELGARLGAVLDFSPLAVEAYRRLGVDADHLPFGYTARWDRHRPGHVSSGPPRLLYLGNKRPRRLSRLAGAAGVLARDDARLVISDNDVPNLATGPSFVAGEDKRDLLASTRLLVNIHQGDEPYFEWLRFAEAAHCGTPVLSERSLRTDPFVAGVHFAEFADDGLSAAITALIDDDDRLAALADAAYERLRERPLADAVDVLVGAARNLLLAPPPVSLPARTRATPLGVERLQELPAATGTALGRPRRLPGRRSHRITVVSSESQDLVAALDASSTAGAASVAVIDPKDLDARAARRMAGELVIVAPPGTCPRGVAFERFLDGAMGGQPASCWSAIVDGLDVDGEPTLEGIWPWEPWRLRAGYHLGRLVVVRADVVRAAAPWFDDPDLRSHPHFLLQSWIATHGGTGGHLATPVACVRGTPLDPAQRVPDRIVERLLAVLAART